VKQLVFALLIVVVWKGAINLTTQRAEARLIRGSTEYWLDTLADIQIRFPAVVLSQMRHETGGFKSAIWIENHNCVGMKWNRRGYATGTNRGHAKYPNMWECLHDYADWQAKYCPASIKTDEEYIDWLVDFGYAEDKRYKEHITNNLNIIKND
jgi:hypothetical protein